ncbi:putative Fe-S cluster-containing radical SAM superfamily enzyme [Paraburkholderia sp. CI3]
MPLDVFDADYPSLRASERLSFDQMEKVAGAFASLGVENIRITGGEPLLRRGLESLVEQLARLTTVSGKPMGIATTTNGSLVAARARALRDAGLGRVTVNLDAVDDAVFRRMSDVALSVSRILDGIEQACAVGLAPVKVNAVIERGVNDSEILPRVRLQEYRCRCALYRIHGRRWRERLVERDGAHRTRNPGRVRDGPSEGTYAVLEERGSPRRLCRVGRSQNARRAGHDAEGLT